LGLEVRALIISGRNVQDQELVYPYYRLDESGYEVVLAAENAGDFNGIQGVKFAAGAAIKDVDAEDFDLLVIPGGVKCMEHLRLNESAIEIVRSFNARKKTIASICSGAQLLITAKVIRGRRISAYPAMRVDVENAGAEFVDAPAVSDAWFVTSPHYRHLGAWMSAVLIRANYPQGFVHA
jgi:protease I